MIVYFPISISPEDMETARKHLGIGSEVVQIGCAGEGTPSSFMEGQRKKWEQMPFQGESRGWIETDHHQQAGG